MITTNIAKKRGRPPAFNRDQAIDIALNLFWRKGYDGVGVAELGKAIGINPPSLYKAFGSKHGLFEEAIKLYMTEDKGGFLPAALAGTKSIEEVASNLLRYAATSYTNSRKPLGCLILSGTNNSTDDGAIATTDAQRQATINVLSNIFSSYQAKNPEALAQYILIAMTGLSVAARQGVNRETLLETAEQFATSKNLLPNN